MMEPIMEETELAFRSVQAFLSGFQVEQRIEQITGEKELAFRSLGALLSISLMAFSWSK